MENENTCPNCGGELYNEEYGSVLDFECAKCGKKFFYNRERMGFEGERIELKPCPFCGGTAKPIHQRWSNRDFYGVSCDGDCGIFFDCRADRADKAAQEWNTRIESPELATD